MLSADINCRRFLSVSAVCCRYYGLVAPKLQTHVSPASAYSSVAYVACCPLLSDRSKPAWAIRAQKCVKASLLGLVVPSTSITSILVSNIILLLIGLAPIV